MYCKPEHKCIILFWLARYWLLLVEEHFVVHNLFFYMHMKHPNSTPSQKHKSIAQLATTSSLPVN